MALTKVGKDGIIGVSNSADADALFIDSSERVGVGATPNATFGSHLYAQGTPAVNKPIISAYSQGNSNKAGIGILNDAGNRGIWTDSNDFLLTTSYEGNSAVHMKIDTNGVITILSEGRAATTSVQQGLAKAFITIDASEGAAFSSNDSFNIGSVTDNGTGNFSIVFTSNMATARYTSPGGCYTATGHSVGVTAEATTGTNLRISDNGGSAADIDSYMAFIGTMA